MALHRDIFWVGRQWAVTGYGIQACDQKQKGGFDIEAARLWDASVLESMRGLAWLDLVDFEKALVAARRYYPEPPPKAAPPEARVLGVIDQVLQQSLSDAGAKQAPVVEPRPADRTFDMRWESWPAKFVSPWRIRIRR
jgi:hypothetical protein